MTLDGLLLGMADSMSLWRDTAVTVLAGVVVAALYFYATVIE